MRTPSDNVLWNEYRQLSTAAENLVASSFQVPAVAVAIVTALAISGNVNTDYFGFGVLIGMFLLSIWLGYYHSTLNRYGLHLVEIEKKINSRLIENPSERLTYYSNFVGVAPTGTQVYVGLLGLLFFVGFGFSLRHIWTITQSWNWKISARVLSVGLGLLTLASFDNIRRTESEFVRQKKKILVPTILMIPTRTQNSHHTPGNSPPRLATFPRIVHSGLRLILLSRIDGDAPRAQID